MIGTTTVHFWNLEITGADLVKQEELLAGRAPTVPVGIIENGFDLGAVPLSRLGSSIRTNLKRTNNQLGDDTIHGTEVASVIFNPEVGISPPGFVAAFTSRPCTFLKGWTPADTEYHQDHYQGVPHRVDCDLSESLLLNRLAKTQVINLSGALGSSRITEQKFKGLTAILVASAGNDPFDPQYPTESLKSRIPAIVVGTIDLDGKRGGSYGDAIDLLAPASTPSLSSADGREFNGPFFGMTSGATAQVTSSLVGVLSILPNLTVQIAERLLKKSGTTNASDRKFLNTYKLIRATQRIETRLNSLNKNPSSKNVSDLLDQEEEHIFNFENEALLASAEAEKLSNKNDCASISKKGRLIRKAFLLNESTQTRAALVKFYRDFSTTAESKISVGLALRLAAFFDSLGKDSATPASGSKSQMVTR